MLLSPLEIQQKQFPNRFRGLDAKEVESFLQKVADQMSVYLKQMDELKRELEDMERQLGEHKEREQTLKNTLISAQKTVEQMKVNAQKESKLLVSEAEVKAERILNNAHNRLAQIHEDIAELKRQRTQFELKIRATIETYQKMLDMQKEEEAEAEDLESKLKFFTRASSGVGPCDVLFKCASDPTPCGCPVAHPSNSRSLRSAQPRKRVPNFTTSRRQFMKHPGLKNCSFFFPLYIQIRSHRASFDKLRTSRA
jgi:cell division initiation protein